MSPVVSVAQGFVNSLLQTIGFPLIILMLSLALVLFLYGCFEYVLGAKDQGAREKGRRHILFGVIGMLVMISAFAIFSIAANTIPGVADPFLPGQPPPSFRP